LTFMRINQELLERLEAKLGVSRGQVYRRITMRVNETKLPRHLAAIDLASSYGINISKYAEAEDLDEIRQSSNKGYVVSKPVTDTQFGERGSIRVRTRPNTTTRKPKKGNIVFVVYGRDERLRKSMFSFLRSIGLKPMEWRKALEVTKKASPYVGEILYAALAKATAVVVLLSPDDEARLKDSLARKDDHPYEFELTGQPRPNVLFEAGMAFGTHPDKTVLVQIGKIRPFSDVVGRHVVRLSNSHEHRQELVTKLRNCGCEVDDSGSDWLTEGDFE